MNTHIDFTNDRAARALRKAGHWAATAAVLGCAVVGAPAMAEKNDFPTSERVIYVEECMRQHPGRHYEMLNKCSCAIDKIAAEVSFDDFETMTTATNANSIGGERGSEIRDSVGMQDQIKRYRTLQATAKKSCFINLEQK